MYSYVYFRLNRDAEATEDIVGDIFLKAYAAFDRYDDRYAISTWLFTIARNTLTDYFRKKHTALPLEDISAVDEQDSLFQLIDRDLTYGELHRVVDGLPERQANYIKQQFFQGLTAREIADREGILHATVRKQISRGLTSLRDALMVYTICILHGIL